MTDKEILIESLKKGVNRAKDKVRGEGSPFSWGDVADYLLANGVVKVVRCKDCKHRANYLGRIMCDLRAEKYQNSIVGLTATEENHFCSYGEVKECAE